jgi:hypothetical protein
MFSAAWIHEQIDAGQRVAVVIHGASQTHIDPRAQVSVDRGKLTAQRGGELTVISLAAIELMTFVPASTLPPPDPRVDAVLHEARWN